MHLQRCFLPSYPVASPTWKLTPNRTPCLSPTHLKRSHRAWMKSLRCLLPPPCGHCCCWPLLLLLVQGIHYAAVFLSDSSRDRVLQFAPPLHEAVSADHLTMAYRPSLQACLELPLGREAQLFVEGVASDYRAQVRSRRSRAGRGEATAVLRLCACVQAPADSSLFPLPPAVCACTNSVAPTTKGQSPTSA